jgi:hypothetical protein
MQLTIPPPYPVYTPTEKTDAQSASAKPREIIYRGYAMENHISQRKTQSFLARGWERVVTKLRGIRDLRYFRSATRTPKPRGAGNLGKLSIAAYRAHWEGKVELVSRITKQFVKGFESNYPEIWPKLKPCEKNHLAEIIKQPAPKIMFDLTQQKDSRTHPIYGHGDGMRIPQFSVAFLEAMQSLESKIAASLYDRSTFTLEVVEPEPGQAPGLASAAPKLEEALNPEMPEQEKRSLASRKWERASGLERSPVPSSMLADSKRHPTRAALFAVDAKPQLSDDERSALKPSPHDAFQNARMHGLHHFRDITINNLKARAENPDEFTRAITQSIGEFDKHYAGDFVSRLDLWRDDFHQYTSADLWDAHNFSIGKAIEAGVRSAVSSRAIPAGYAPEYKKQLGDMCLQINHAIVGETNILKPVIASADLM